MFIAPKRMAAIDYFFFHVFPKKKPSRYRKTSAVSDTSSVLYILNGIWNHFSERISWSHDLIMMAWRQQQQKYLLCSSMHAHSTCNFSRLTRVPTFSSTARQIQRAPSVRTDVWPAVVRPPRGLWEREEPRAFHTQHSARLFLLLQVSSPPLTIRV